MEMIVLRCHLLSFARPMIMLKRITRGWAFAKSSWSILKRYPTLVILPIISSVVFLLLFGAMAMVVISILDLLPNTEFSAIGFFAIAFGLYFICGFIFMFFNAALVFCTLEALSGRTPSLSQGLAAASRRLPQILAWTFVSATVGVILNMLEDKLDRLGIRAAAL